MNLRVGATLEEDVAAVGSIAVHGTRHDAYVFGASGLKELLEDILAAGDLRYIGIEGIDMIFSKKTVGRYPSRLLASPGGALSQEFMRSLKRISQFKYTVVLGQERHSITFFLDQFWGRVVIKVDEVSVLDTKIPHMSLKLKRRFSFNFGSAEEHRMVIEMERKLAFAGFRPLTYRIFIDGQLATTLER